MMRKVSIATFGLQAEYGDFRALEIAKEAGADAVDFSLKEYDYRRPDCIYSKSDEEIRQYFSALGDHAKKLGIEIGQTHGRATGFKNIKEEDDALVANARIDCLVTKALNAPVCVAHHPTTIHLGPDASPELMHELAFDQFSRILVHAKQYGVKIAVETFGDAAKYGCCDFFGNINELLASYQRLKATGDNADYLAICVDTGHSNKAMRFGNPTPADVLRMCGADVKVLHLNDNDGATDQHKMPKAGNIDWDDVLNALDEIGYSGICNMELRLGYFGEDFMPEEAAFAIKVLKNLMKHH